MGSFGLLSRSSFKKQRNSITTTIASAIIIVIVIVAAVAGFVFLNQGTSSIQKTSSSIQTSSIQTTSTTSSSSLKVPSTIKIGYIAAFSGSAAIQDKELLRGAQLAIDEINSKGGIFGTNITLVIEDGRSDATQAALALQKLVSQDNVLAVLGAYPPADNSVSATAGQNHVPFLPGYSADIKLFQSGNQYLFRIYADGYDNSVGDAQFLMQLNPQPKTIAFITVQNVQAEQQVNITGGMIAKAGIRTVFSQEYNPFTIKDFTSVLVQVKPLNPDIIMTIGYVSDGLLLRRQLGQQGIFPKMLFMRWAGGLTGFAQGAGNLKENVLFDTTWATGMTTSGSASLNSSIYRKYGVPAENFHAIGYSDVLVVADSIKRVLSHGTPLDRESLRSSLAGTDMMTPLGRVKFSVNPSDHPLGEIGHNIYVINKVAQYQNGLPLIVFPTNMSLSKVNYPAQYG